MSKTKLKQIIQGWKNLVFKDPEIEKLALKRAEICSTCKNNNASICIECGCPLAAKTRSPKETCPIQLW